MSCTTIMDVKPLNEKFTFSQTGKSATIQCSFSGVYKCDRVVNVDVMLTRRSCPAGKDLKTYASELESLMQSDKTGLVFRIYGQLRCLQYQDFNSGDEVQSYQLVADTFEISDEEKPVFSNVVMKGGVRPLSNTDIYKDIGKTSKITFWLWAEPETNFEREGYLSLLVYGFGEIAESVKRMKVKEKSHVIATGKLEATERGYLSIKLFNLNYANRKSK